jgi:dTDP-glucose 4,6-dehydratase
MKLLVTGGAGFIGSHFIEMLLSKIEIKLEKIFVLDKLTYAGTLKNLDNCFGNPFFEFVEGDICDLDIVDKLISEVDYVVNFAAETHVDRSILDSKNFVYTNVLGTQVLLESARRQRVKKFVQISTDEVYGSIQTGSWDESQPLRPNSPYAASKASADLLVLAYFKTYGLNINITRSSNNFGPRQNTEKLIPNFVTSLRQGENVKLYGNGGNVRDWIYVVDNCAGIFLVLQKGSPGEIYNIGGNMELSNNKVTEMILNHMKLKKSRINYVMDRLGHDFRYSVNTDKISDLGYRANTDFRFALEKTIDWYLEVKP